MLTPARSRVRSPSARDVVHSLPEWDTSLGRGWADRIMAVGESNRKHVKQGRSIVRWAVSDSVTVYLKRHFELPRILGWLARVFPGRAWSPGLQEWNHLEWARKAGLPVPRAVAAGEFRGPGCRLQSFLAVEELAGQLALHEAIPIAATRLAPAEFERWKRGLVAELARLCRGLHRRRRFHRDLYLCHFFISEADLNRVPTDWYGRVVVIDFHRLGHYPLTWSVRQVKDLAQFLFSTQGVKGIYDRDRIRFWKVYRKGDWGRVTRPVKLQVRFVRWKAHRYGRHNAKHDLSVPRKD